MVKARIEAQQKQLQTHLKQISSHIATRVGEDIALLVKPRAKQELGSNISHQQLDNVIASRVGENFRLLEKPAELVPSIPHQQWPFQA